MKTFQHLYIYFFLLLIQLQKMQTNINNVSTFLTNKTSTLIDHTNLLQNKNHLLLKNILQLVNKNKLLLQKSKNIKQLNYSINQLLSLSPTTNEDIIKYILTHYVQVLSNAEGIALSHKECKYKIKQLIYEHVLSFPHQPHYEICNEVQLFYSANKRIQHCVSCSAVKHSNHTKTPTKKREGSLSYNRMLKCKSKQLFGYADAYGGKNTTRNGSNNCITSRTLNVEKESSTERKNELFKTTVGRRGRTRKNNCVLCNSNTLFSNSNVNNNNNNNNNISHLESGCNNIPPIPIIASEYDYVTPKSTYDDTMNLLSTIKKYA